MSHNLVALRRKHAARAGTRVVASASVLDGLRHAMDEERVLSRETVRSVAREHGVPDAIAHGVATYYGDFSDERRGDVRIHACVGTACVATAGRAHVEALEAATGVRLGETRSDGALSLEPTYCLGLCHAAPAAMVDLHQIDGSHVRRSVAGIDLGRARAIAAGDPAILAEPEPRPRIASFATRTIVLRNIVDGADATTLAGARARGVYSALEAAVPRGAAAVLDEVERSSLRGRGGAGFPAATKWRFAAAQPPGEKFVVCNADEGDPGSTIDKWLMELDPHSILEGMALCGLAIGAADGVIYLRSEYPRAAEVLARAIEEARNDGWLGRRTRAGRAFDVRLVVGAGSYVCGEETALLHSIEGLRGVVTARPPYPAVAGLYEKPTVVNNVETLLNVPWIVSHGGAAFAALGLGKSRGTKAVSLSERFARPGLYEVELGMTLRRLCEEVGGGMADGSELLGLQIGGPLGGIVPASALDTALGFEELDAIGALLGHAGVVAFTTGTDMREIARHLFEFGDAESCGKCFPCRIGMKQGLDLVDRMRERGGNEGDVSLLEALLETMKLGSLCAHGGGLPAPIESILRHWRDDLLAAPRGSQCPSMNIDGALSGMVSSAEALDTGESSVDFSTGFQARA